MKNDISAHFDHTYNPAVAMEAFIDAVDREMDLKGLPKDHPVRATYQRLKGLHGRLPRVATK